MATAAERAVPGVDNSKHTLQYIAQQVWCVDDDLSRFKSPGVHHVEKALIENPRILLKELTKLLVEKGVETPSWKPCSVRHAKKLRAEALDNLAKRCK